MAGEKTELASDFRDLLQAFVDHEVRFLIVGAYALAIHGHPRATGDLDLWVDPTTGNANKRALGRTRDLADAERLDPAESEGGD